jgi:deoxyhypusine synthase
VPHYRSLSAAEEQALHDRGMNRVTDTCIPEQAAMRRIERYVIDAWRAAESKGERRFPHEFLFRVIRDGHLEEHHQIDPRDSWMVAAATKDLPVWVPGWEDSTLGNMFVASVESGVLESYQTVKSGLEYMGALVSWYREAQESSSIGFFQIGGGIAGDFPICVVPLIHQDMKEDVRYWGYFCQISDSTTSYGSYSGAVPNEKITWGKVDVDTPTFVIESDATIVFPLVAAHVLDW